MRGPPLGLNTQVRMIPVRKSTGRSLWKCGDFHFSAIPCVFAISRHYANAAGAARGEGGKL
jgi:hypothetical protein